MPDKSMRPCTHPGCGVLVSGGRCATHKKQKWRENRSDNSMYNTAQWKKFRAAWLRLHSLCGDRVDGSSSEHSQCARAGQAVPAVIADHIKPHRGDPAMFYDESNIQSLCKDCHDRKTGQEMRGSLVVDGEVQPQRERTVQEDNERLVESLTPETAVEPEPEEVPVHRSILDIVRQNRRK